jgi:hypothetical protein
MDFYFDDYSNFSAQHTLPSCRTPTSTYYTPNFYPHEPCSYCSNPNHSVSNCPSWGQFYNFSYEQMNTNFSSSGFDSNFNFYNSDWSNHFDFSWQAQDMGNCAPQFQELHHFEYLQFDDQSSHPSSYNYPASSSQSTLEDSLKALMQFTSQTINEMKNATLENTQAISDMKNATMENTQAIARIEGQFEYLVAKVTRIEEEEFQSQPMATGHYMIDDDDFNNPYYEHVQATSTLGSVVVFEEIVNEPSLEDPFEESGAQIKFDLDLVPKKDKALLDSTLEIRLENEEITEISFPNTSSSKAEEEEKGEHLESVEHLEHTAPLSNPNMSTDKEMTIEANSFITIPLETFHEPQASVLQCLQMPSFAKSGDTGSKI